MTEGDISSESETADAVSKNSGRWSPAVTVVFACLLIVGGAGWWGTASRSGSNRLSNEVVAPTTAAGGGVATLLPSALATSFQVDIKVEPTTAQIIFDGKEVARGHFQLELPRDGQFHEIRIVADGYAPERFLFADAPPQREVVLEPADEEESDSSEGLPARRSPLAAPPAARAGRVARPGNRQEVAPLLPESPARARNEIIEASPPLRPPTPEPVPSVKIIEDREPNIRVVE